MENEKEEKAINRRNKQVQSKDECGLKQDD